MGMEALLKGLASRMFPQPASEATPDMVWLNKYGAVMMEPLVRKQYSLADRNAYYVANNGQTGIATPAVAAWGATTPLMVIANGDTPGNPQAKTIYLDYIILVTTAAGGWASAGVSEQLMLYTDVGDLYTSGATDLTAKGQVYNANMLAPKSQSVARVRFGNCTAAAQTPSARPICGLRTLRPAVSATVADVVGEQKLLNFGGVEGNMSGNIVVANPNFITIPMPPVPIPPGQCLEIYFVLNGTTPAAVSFAPEVGWWEL